MHQSNSLDGTELFHLAIEASGRDDHGVAITYLKQALDLPEGGAATSADYAKYLYMLGAEYAQIGMMERAVSHMAQALDMDPALHTARLQLGLLHIKCNQLEQAFSVLEALQKLPDDSALRHFGAGLQHLLQDQIKPCCDALLRGVELNSASAAPNLALNADMQKLLAALEAHGGGAEKVGSMGSTEAEAGFLMSAYNRSNAAN